VEGPNANCSVSERSEGFAKAVSVFVGPCFCSFFWLI